VPGWPLRECGLSHDDAGLLRGGWRNVHAVHLVPEHARRPHLMELSPSEFETMVTNLFAKMGLETKFTEPSRDGGVDCVAYDFANGKPIELTIGGNVLYLLAVGLEVDQHGPVVVATAQGEVVHTQHSR